MALYGGLGMGKTAFVRGLAAGLGIQAEVSSPTFALVHDYGGSPPLIHFDMYRISGWEDLYTTGFFDYLEAAAFWRWNGAKTSRRPFRQGPSGWSWSGWTKTGGGSPYRRMKSRE